MTTWPPSPTTPLSRLRIGLGTFVAVDAESDDRGVAELGIAAAFDAVRRVERLMRPDGSGSDLARLSGCPAGCHLMIHPWTWEVLDLCRRLNEASDGIFDPCLPEARGRMRDLELLGGSQVRVHAPLRLDLGGIAKGYAIDRAVEALKRVGCHGGLVNAGGDLAVFGPRSRRILCRGPGDSHGTFELRELALATSEIGEPSRPPQHRGHYHGVSGAIAATGRISVVAARAAVADGLTKCLLWCDRASADALLLRFDARRLDAQNARPKPRSKRLKSGFHSNHW